MYDYDKLMLFYSRGQLLLEELVAIIHGDLDLQEVLPYEQA